MQKIGLLFLDFIARFAKVKKLINAAAFDLILRFMKI